MALQNIGPQQPPRYWGPAPAWLPEPVARVYEGSICMQICLSALTVVGTGLVVVSAQNAYADFSAGRFKMGVMDGAIVWTCLVAIAILAPTCYRYT